MAETTPAASESVGLVPVRRALLSVSDKAGLAEFAGALHREFGVELISTGGTAKFLRDAGLPVTDVSDLTGFPEMMDGRVKTLHPKVHGGLLAQRDHADHVASMAEHGILPIDLVCINLYPFAKTIENPRVTLDEAIENIDIGGPSMVRSAAKNNAWVVVVTAPSRYEKVLGDLRKHGGRSCAALRLKQAQSAFAHTAEYDGLIAKYLAKEITPAVDEGVEGTTSPTLVAVDPSRQRTDPADEAFVVRATADSAPWPAKFYAALLLGQIRVSGGTEACVFRARAGGALEPVFASATPRAMFVTKPADTSSLLPIAVESLKANRDEAVKIGGETLYPPGPPTFALATPLRHGGKTEAISVVVVRCDGQQAADDLLMAVQVVAGEYARFAAHEASAAAPLMDTLTLSLTKVQNLRYGENPHQRAALYVGEKPREASVAFARQHHGKELSYINLLDADGALACVKEFALPAACIVKHTTPCGCAAADDLATAFQRAYAGDPLAAFGGIVALNKPVDLAAAQAITGIDKLLEVIVAPSYAEDALELLRSRWKNVRLLECGVMGYQPMSSDHGLVARATEEISLHKIVGGYLVQERDLLGLDESTWRVASQRPPTEAEMADLRFAWLVCKHVKSNAIAVCKGRMLLGAGAGQMDRPSAARLAVAKAGDRITGAVAASDAFFPFPDGPKLLLDAGVTAIIHPGGSLKDQETIDLIDSRGGALVLTGQRHFKH